MQKKSVVNGYNFACPLLENNVLKLDQCKCAFYDSFTIMAAHSEMNSTDGIFFHKRLPAILLIIIK